MARSSRRRPSAAALGSSLCSSYFLLISWHFVSVWIWRLRLIRPSPLAQDSAPFVAHRWFSVFPRLLFKSSLTCAVQGGSLGINSSDYVWMVAGWSRYSSWVAGPKDSRVRSLNRSPVVVSRTCPPGVWWNACEDINCSSIWFLLSISLVVLPAPFQNLGYRPSSCEEF
jgi:hypothetical protein